ncbi:MAG: SDR family NAD(P)-dependent oxidoreductase [Lacipirellulaceae bacterium]
MTHPAAPLEGRRALVTGASSGIGRELAIRLAERGARVALLARNVEGLAETGRLVREAKRDPLVLPGDATSAADRQRALDAIVAAWGGLDLLVNNAGVSAHGRFHESRPERLRTIFEVNLFTAAELTREATPLLGNGQRPCVAFVGSILGWRGAPHNAEYCASKFALRGFAEAIRPELARLGVHVLHASPGTVATGFFDHLVEKRGELPWGRRRGVTPRFVAERIVRGIERRANEVTIGWQAEWFVRATRWAPWLVDRMMKRYG